jgi:signal transduction histidine kinase
MKARWNSKLLRNFVFNVIAIMVITLLVMISFALISAYLGFFPNKNKNPIVLFIAFLSASMLLSLFFTIRLGYRIFTPIELWIDATKKVSKGDFSILMNEKHPIPEIRDMNIHFNKMIRELSGIETLRNDFIVNVSHEFKTPIASIEGYAMLLQDPLLSLEERTEFSQIILKSTKQLSSLSENILRLSEFETKEIMPKKKTFSLDEQLRQAILFLENKWSKKNIEINIELPSVIFYGSEDLLMQVWLNIFENAVKFTPENGIISISLTGYDNGVCVAISDTGIGMNDDVQKHIFDKFFKGDRIRNSEGNGLGLTLVKRIIEMFDGKIDVQSQLGKGSLFTIWLPQEK